MRLFIFIDASNIWEAQKAKGRFFDYEKLSGFLKKRHAADAVEVFYYTAYPAEGTRNYSMEGKHKFFTFLKKGLGFNVVKKELKRISIATSDGEHFEEKGNMDVEMTIDVMHNKEKFDVAVFFSGDSDFLALITYLRNAGKKAYVYSSRNNVSQELRTGSDGYTDVLLIKDNIWGKDLNRRPK